MTYISLYRKWRPQNFDEVIGQGPIVKTLQNAIKLGRLSHAYLFSGPRGTGKTTTARVLAKALNCEKGPTPDPCGKCDRCIRIKDGHSVDVIEIDAASNRGIDEIRELRERVRFSPIEGDYKIYIIDEVHMLTQEAFNALLKTLEEPPKHIIFVLATTEPTKVPLTILSRCQRLDFGRIPLRDIMDHLLKVAKGEGFKIDEEALNLIARSADGSMRDAVSLLDQLVSFCGNSITFDDVVTVLGTADEELLFLFGDAISSGDIAKGFDLVGKAVKEGMAIPQVTKDLVGHFRHMLLIKVGSTEGIDLTKEYLEKLKGQAGSYSIEDLKEIIGLFSRAETDMKWHPHARLVLEVATMEAMRGRSEKKVPVKEPLPRTEDKKIETNKKIDAEEVHKETGSPTLLRIKSSWEEILNKVKSRSPFSFVSLHEGEPVEINGRGKLVIRFRKGYSFHKERLEDETNKGIVEDAIRDIIGQEIRIEGLVSEVETGRIEEKAISLDKVTDLFGGKVVK